mgnify:CR=1 FL=1
MIVEPPSLPLIRKSPSLIGVVSIALSEFSEKLMYDVPLSLKAIKPLFALSNKILPVTSSKKKPEDVTVKLVPSPVIVSPASPNSIDLLAPKITLSLNVAAIFY